MVKTPPLLSIRPCRHPARLSRAGDASRRLLPALIMAGVAFGSPLHAGDLPPFPPFPGGTPPPRQAPAPRWPTTPPAPPKPPPPAPPAPPPPPPASAPAPAPFKSPFLIPFSALPALDPSDLPAVIRRHILAIGGPEAISTLQSTAIKGVIRPADGDEALRFEMWSARPNLNVIRRLSSNRTVTKGYDGVNPPWLLDSAQGTPVDMDAKTSRVFIADAEFDDAFVASLTRNAITLNYAGRTLIEGRPAARYLVTQNITELSYLFLDLETFLIVRRDVPSRDNAGPGVIENYCSDYQSVNGVMLPTRITQKRGTKTVLVVHIEHIEANPAIDPAIYRRPPRVPPDADPSSP